MTDRFQTHHFKISDQQKDTAATLTYVTKNKHTNNAYSSRMAEKKFQPLMNMIF